MSLGNARVDTWFDEAGRTVDIEMSRTLRSAKRKGGVAVDGRKAGRKMGMRGEEEKRSGWRIDGTEKMDRKNGRRRNLVLHLAVCMYTFVCTLPPPPPSSRIYRKYMTRGPHTGCVCFMPRRYSVFLPLPLTLFLSLVLFRARFLPGLSHDL